MLRQYGNGVPGLNLAGIEYFHDGSGGFVTSEFSGAIKPAGFEVIKKNTAWTDSTAGVSTGAYFKEEVFDESATEGSTAHPASDLSGPWQFWLDSRHGLFTTAGSPQQVALFKVDMGHFIRYFLGFGDIYKLQGPTPACQFLEDEMEAFCTVVSDRDYNDFVVSFDQEKPGTPVPEPTMLALLGLGLLGAGAVRRRQRN